MKRKIMRRDRSGRIEWWKSEVVWRNRKASNKVNASNRKEKRWSRKRRKRLSNTRRGRRRRKWRNLRRVCKRGRKLGLISGNIILFIHLLGAVLCFLLELSTSQTAGNAIIPGLGCLTQLWTDTKWSVYMHTGSIRRHFTVNRLYPSLTERSVCLLNVSDVCIASLVIGILSEDLYGHFIVSLLRYEPLNMVE